MPETHELGEITYEVRTHYLDTSYRVRIATATCSCGVEIVQWCPTHTVDPDAMAADILRWRHDEHAEAAAAG